MSNKARTEKPPEQMTPEEWAEVTRAELLALLQAYRAKWGDEIVGPFISRMERETGTQGFHLIKHKFAIEYSIEEHEPVNARSVDFYGIKLHSGYVREGDLYVFKSETPPDKGEVL